MNATKLSIRRVAVALMVGSYGAAVSAHGNEDPRGPRPAKFGQVSFKTSCSPEAQKQFDAALSLLHSFFFPETVKAFSAIPQTDPQCAIAYWGIAISQRPNPLVGPFDAATLKRGLEAIEKGETIGAKTERERDWLAALKEFYKDYDKVDQDTRAKNYEHAMAALAKKYPKDPEATIFYALALNETYDHSDHTYANLLKAAKLLGSLDKKYPNHPGITHYIIHSYDFAPIAQRGVPAANKYAKIAPDAPHALHMPSHIYSMIGAWDASIAANQRTLAASRAYSEKVNLDGLYGAIPHSWDFMQYAYLQQGRDSEAKKLVEEVTAVKKLFTAGIVQQGGLSAIPARYMLERQDWKGAAELQPLAVVNTPAGLAVTHFARALGAARGGDIAAAQADIEKLKGFREALEKAKQSYWAGQVEIQILGAQAWTAYGQANKDEALKLMGAAADLEDASEKHVAMENRLYPMRELLGDMLLETGQPQAALKEYEASMTSAKNRLRSYYGAAMAAKAVGDTKKASRYLSHLAQLTRNADGERPELKELRVLVVSR
ncbi:MAG: hypothetical protein ABI831_12335 [Betaproteobacteria bacterium]